MNTNRGSYMLGAALGSALVLTLCVKAHAADIYEAPPAQVVEAPPPPPLDRGIYLKGYIGQANPDVGQHLDRRLQHRQHLQGVPRRHQELARCTASASAGSTATGCASISRASIVATPLFVGQDRYPSSSRRHERVHGRHQELAGLANAYIDSAAGAASRRTSARASASPRSRSNGLEDINVAAVRASFYGADNTTPTSPGRCTPARATTSLRSSASISPIATPTSAPPGAA